MRRRINSLLFTGAGIFERLGNYLINWARPISHGAFLDCHKDQGTKANVAPLPCPQLAFWRLFPLPLDRFGLGSYSLWAERAHDLRRNIITFCCRFPAAARKGATAGRHRSRGRSSKMIAHRPRRSTFHLPARRTRPNVDLFLRRP